MTLETFFEKFDQLADTPNAVSRMRRFILDLAVRGKLVAQNPDDEPADELLKRVRTEKERLVMSGEIKKQELLPPVEEDSIPSLLPSGWSLTQLGDVAVCLDYMREPINGSERDLRIVGKTQSELFPYYGATQQQGWIDDYIFDAELVLLGEDGVPFFDDLRPKAYLISGKSWVNNHAHVFRGILASNPFLMHWLNTFDYTGRVAGSTRSKLNQAKAVDIPIALPPLAEQKRIVAKVDELMALCDRLEAQQQERETRHAVLARASLARFTDAPTLANLPFLFHPSYTIPPADLRKSILTLAVQGKLVPQDPNDESVDELLARSLIARQNLKRTIATEVQAIDGEAALGFDIPVSWRWQTLDDLLVFGPTNGFSPKAVEYETLTRSLTLSATTLGRFNGKYSKFITTDVPPDSDLWLRDGDILVQRGNTIEYVGVAAVYRGEPNRFVYPDLMMKLRVSSAFDVGYIHLAMSQEAARNFLRARASGTSGTMPKINQATLKSLPIPIPPLAEQLRIVAKVDQLMVLVDQLETQLAASRATSKKLMEAVVDGLTAQE